jgi:formylglycine-generating enzyme required for sulfatase activity
LDNDCDGVSDEGFDVDGDGYSACGGPDGGWDCDDSRADVHQGHPEGPDGIDNDCDGLVDDEDPDYDPTPFGMVLIEAGDWAMGCSTASCPVDEQPVHVVSLPAFYMDRLEVSVADYGACVGDGVCTAPAATGGFVNNWQWSGREQHPVNFVTWEQAQRYCEWRGRRLPSEAEWERAARGTGALDYPWGDEPSPDCAHTVMESGGWGCGEGHTWPVGSLVEGGSLEGLLNLAGNVSEWTADWYASDWYASDGGPAGPSEGVERVLRGGNWQWGADYARATWRGHEAPGTAEAWLGFRCAKTVE